VAEFLQGSALSQSQVPVQLKVFPRCIMIIDDSYVSRASWRSRWCNRACSLYEVLDEASCCVGTIDMRNVVSGRMCD